MASTADNYKIVYLRLTYANYQSNPDILQLATRCGNKEWADWIKPTKPISQHSKAYQNGLIKQHGELFHDDKKLETVHLETALTTFFKFITSEPKNPVLLVTHSSRYELSLLFEAIQNTGMAHMFDGVIQRVADTVSIFEKKFPSLVGKSQLTLKVLTEYVLGEEYRVHFFDILDELKYLTELVSRTSISPFDLISNGESYEEFMLRLRESKTWGDSLHGLTSILSVSTVWRLKKSKISYNMLKDISQRGDYTELHRYLNEQSKRNFGVTIHPTTTERIFAYFNKQNQRNNRDESYTARQKKGNDEAGTSFEAPFYNKDYSFPQEQQELVDKEGSFTNVQGSSTGRQEKPEAQTLSIFPDQEARRNDYLFKIESFQEVFHPEIPSSMEEQNRAVNQDQRDRENMEKWSAIFESFY